MNREIKFRIWDKINNQWSRTAHLSPIYGLEIFSQHDNGIIPLQFTGLFDKNGREIYEGDVIEYNSWTTGSYGSKFTGEVRFGEETAGFAIFNKEDGTEQILWGDEQDYLTVIGNIFENPELL